MEGCNQTTCHGAMPRTEVLIVICKDKKGGRSSLPTLQGGQTQVCSVTPTSPEFRVVEYGHRPLRRLRFCKERLMECLTSVTGRAFVEEPNRPAVRNDMVI